MLPIFLCRGSLIEVQLVESHGSSIMYLYAYVRMNECNYVNTFSELSLPSFEDFDILILHISIGVWLFARYMYINSTENPWLMNLSLDDLLKGSNVWVFCVTREKIS